MGASRRPSAHPASARLEASVSPGATRITRSAARDQAAFQAAGDMPAILDRPHMLGVELRGERSASNVPPSEAATPIAGD
jgi:hypothetical protein